MNVMKYEERKIVGVVASNVDPVVALNVIGHLALAVGQHAGSEILGRPKLIDKSGGEHLGISRFPVIITKVKPSKLKSVIEQAKQSSQILVADYPQEMPDTRTDDELVAALAECGHEQMVYLGAILYGDTTEIDKLTGKFQLWRID